MRRLKIIDIIEQSISESIGPTLSDDFGRNLNTIAKARQWLIHPSNWFNSKMFVIRWDGLIPKISATHGQRLINEPWDNGLPEVVVREQIRIRMGAKADNEGQDLEGNKVSE